MKPAEFKKRISILLACIKFTYQIETAFRVNNWANVLSTCFYSISQILFINVLYSNVNLIAGYTKNEMLLFMFVGQTGYYISWLIHTNLLELKQDVNKGKLDILLVKPISPLFYITFRKIKLFSVIRDCLPPSIVLALTINWRSLHFSPDSLLAGCIITFLGIICAHVIHFLATIPVFWLGESESIFNLSKEFEYNVGKVIPYEGFSQKLRLLLTTLLPVMLSTALSTSVMLHKTQIAPALLLTITVTVFSLIVRQLFWNEALRTYTSASS